MFDVDNIWKKIVFQVLIEICQQNMRERNLKYYFIISFWGSFKRSYKKIPYVILVSH